ncbi:membrane protein [Gordonia phage Avazak]|uniref:Membrane protein n=1 Tax=Gordonia phage Avazak TaxID=2656529 RepID=A0A649V6T8_9CAUD|nr:membrane protein [Gordonia phage Avazak]QGJ88020.1 membrane protein [Gordonia phage Avazak]
MMNPVKKIKNIDDDTKLALSFAAMYAGAAVVTITAVVAGTVAVAYGAAKLAEHVTDEDN